MYLVSIVSISVRIKLLSVTLMTAIKKYSMTIKNSQIQFIKTYNSLNAYTFHKLNK